MQLYALFCNTAITTANNAMLVGLKQGLASHQETVIFAQTSANISFIFLLLCLLQLFASVVYFLPQFFSGLVTGKFWWAQPLDSITGPWWLNFHEF